MELFISSSAYVLLIGAILFSARLRDKKEDPSPESAEALEELVEG